jgi:hypothetical protein
MNYRGWDPTRVFAPSFDNLAVSMEGNVSLAQMGDLAFVDSPERPSVRAFFEQWSTQSLILNGLWVPSVSHAECLKRVMTGSNDATAADWPILLAQAATERYGLPHILIRGPVFPGRYGAMSTRIGSGEGIARILDGSLVTTGDQPEPPLGEDPNTLIQRFIRSRNSAYIQRHLTSTERRQARNYEESIQRAEYLRQISKNIEWSTDGSLGSQVQLATQLLSLGVCRCLTLALESDDWDSHSDNDRKQSYLFESLFSALSDLMIQLEERPGSQAPTLAEETVVVVLSEMGRTPAMNSGKGKDHWSHTSALLIGPGLTGGRSIGGFDDYYYSKPLDFATGALSEQGRVMEGAHLGALLLQLGDVDPVEFTANSEVLEGVLA